MTRVVSLLFHDVYERTPDESGFCSPAADRYKLSVRAFDAQLAALASADLPAVADLEAPEALAGNGRGFVLTVDDGGISYYTTVADRLEARGWRGACFVTTNFVGRRGFLAARQIRELDARGHTIGSHSASHPTRFSTLSRAQMLEEWRDSRRALEDLLGREVRVASLPGGYFSRAVAETAGQAGYRVLFTSEPVTGFAHVDGCLIAGRFAIRGNSRRDLSRALVAHAPWARGTAWAMWNVKGLAKPLLGSSYPRFSNWLTARRAIS